MKVRYINSAEVIVITPFEQDFCWNCSKEHLGEKGTVQTELPTKKTSSKGSIIMVDACKMIFLLNKQIREEVI